VNRGALGSIALAVLLGGLLVVVFRGDGDPAKAAAEAEQLTEQGKQRLAAGDPNGALERFEAALKVTPGVPPLLFNTAVAAEQSGRLQEAEQRYRDAIDSFKPEEDWRFYTGLGNLLLRTKRAAAAVAPLSRAVALHDAVETHRPYQDALRKCGKTALAEQMYADRMAERPDEVDALYLYARLIESPAGRAKTLTTALERDPDHFWSHLALGATYLEINDARSALKAYHAARALDPPNTKALFGLVRCHVALKDQESAQAALKQLEDRHPESSVTRAARALIDDARW